MVMWMKIGHVSVPNLQQGDEFLCFHYNLIGLHLEQNFPYMQCYELYIEVINSYMNSLVLNYSQDLKL